MRTNRGLLIAAIVWMAVGPGVPALPADVQVNTYTSGAQRFPVVSSDSDGDFVVVWQGGGSGGTDSSGYSIQGQRFAASGSAVATEFQINTYTEQDQRSPWVGLDAGGGFVVVWQSDGSGGTDTSGYSVQGQRFAADGSAIAAEFQVNTYSTNDQRFPKVALAADGGFVVVWQSDGSGGTDSSGYSIQGRRFAADGSPVSAEFQINTYTTGEQRVPAVSLDADGDFVVVWSSYGSGATDPSSYSIQGQRFASDGTTSGAAFQVNTYTTSLQSRSSVSMDADGDFVEHLARIPLPLLQHPRAALCCGRGGGGD